MRRRLPAFLLFLGFTLTACGTLEALQDRLEARRAAIREALEQQAGLALEANDLADLTDDMEFDIFEDDTGLLQQQQSIVGPTSSPQALVLAPTLAGGSREVTVTRFACGLNEDLCFPKKVVATERIASPRGGEVSVSAEAEFQYYAELVSAVSGEAGDLNEEQKNRDAYVAMTFTLVRSGSGPEGGAFSIETSGKHIFSLKQGEWYVVDAAFETTGFPATPDGRAGVSSISVSRTFAVPETTATAGVFKRVVIFSDDTTAYTVRNVDFDRATDVVSGDWTHEGRFGFVGEGTFEVDTQGTPRCRLDDTGVVDIERTFGEKVTRATGEIVHIEKNGTTATLTGTLTLADTTTKSKSFTRTVVSPETCGDPTAVRTFTVEGTTYRGAQISFTETRSPGSLRLDGERELPNGNTQHIELVRSQGVTNVHGEVHDSAETTIATLHVVLHPDGSGHGTVTRTIDGEKVTRKFTIDGGEYQLKN